MTEAKKFYKEHKDYCNPNPMTGDYVIEPEDLFRIMEDYHQHKVNNGVLDDVNEPFYCDIIEGEEGFRCKKQCSMCKNIENNMTKQ